MEIELLIKNRFKTLYSSKAISVSGTNDKGRFDILANHANFISVIKDKLIIDIGSKKEEFIISTQAVMKVQDNKVFVYVGM